MNPFQRHAWALATVTLTLYASGAFAQDASESATVRYGRKPVVTYRASLEHGYLIVEATHAEGWHTYTMDNIERAREASGKESPETELPTRIEITGGAAPTGEWWQSVPKDLTMAEIKWYTWGFEKKAYFIARVNDAPGETVEIAVRGQACNSSSCAMVDGVSMVVAKSDDAFAQAPEEPTALADTPLVRIPAKGDAE